MRRERKLTLCLVAHCRDVAHLVPDGLGPHILDLIEQCADALSQKYVNPGDMEKGDPALSAAIAQLHTRYGELNPWRDRTTPRSADWWAAAAIRQTSQLLGRLGLHADRYSDSTHSWAASAVETAGGDRKLAWQRQTELEAEISVPFAAGGDWMLELQRKTELEAEISTPFSDPEVFNPSWRTSTALALAGGIYADRAFDRLQILADALEDAGCENADILSHCRDPKLTHVRGCWAVDLVLAKN